VKELAERDTSGAIAVVYDEIKRVCAVPYVSSMQLYVLLLRELLAGLCDWLDVLTLELLDILILGI